MNDIVNSRLGFRDLVANLIESEEIGSLVPKKGSLMSMGINRGNFVFLNSLETLYLLEKNSICLQVGNVPLSLQEAFRKYWNIKYQSFKELRNLGFSIKCKEFQQVYKPKNSVSREQYDFQVETVDANSYLSVQDLKNYRDYKMQVAIVDGSDVSFIKINSVKLL